jgi:SAM-dependent methyltransferase
MIDKSKIKETIKKLGTWYQNVNIYDTPTVGRKEPYSNIISVNKVFNNIKSFIPVSLKGLRILDLGCNAGFHSLNMALLGAEVIGVETNNIFYNQALFLKRYYDEIYQQNLNVTYVQKNISDINFKELGKFDYVLALAIIYHIGKGQYGKCTDKALDEQLRVLKMIDTKNFIVGTRNGPKNNINHYNGVFNKLGFNNLKTIPGGKRSWVLYGRI